MQFDHLRRREFITFLGGATAAWPLAARAQQTDKVWRMGFIAHGHESFYDALFEGLREYGYEEGHNLIVERRYARGQAERGCRARRALESDQPRNRTFLERDAGAARKLEVTLQSHEVRGPEDFAAAFAMIAEERPDALLVVQDAVTMQQRNEIVDFAIQTQLPSMFQEKGWAMAGGLMSYGENLASMYRRAAYFVDRIFKGAKPADLPVEQATKFDMILNLRTAKAIGVTFPDSILALADEVIE